MSEIQHIADTEFNELLEHVDLGYLDVIESCTDGLDVLEELLGVVSDSVDDMLSMSVVACR